MRNKRVGFIKETQIKYYQGSKGKGWGHLIKKGRIRKGCVEEVESEVGSPGRGRRCSQAGMVRRGGDGSQKEQKQKGSD